MNSTKNNSTNSTNSNASINVNSINSTPSNNLAITNTPVKNTSVINTPVKNTSVINTPINTRTSKNISLVNTTNVSKNISPVNTTNISKNISPVNTLKPSINATNVSKNISELVNTLKPLVNSKEYTVLPFEPTLFKRTVNVSIGNQIQANPVDVDFASVYTDSVSNEKLVTYLDQPVKTINASVKAEFFSYSLNQETSALLQKIKSDPYITIELKDVPPFVKTYVDYEKFIINFISTLQNKNIYLNTNYVEDIIKNINKYTIKGISLIQYGFCTSTNPVLKDIFNYTIDKSTLMKNITAIGNKELIVQTNVICKDTTGISNTFGSQLWLYDFLFQLASSNVKRAYIDISSINNAYTIMAFSYATRNKAVLYSPVINYGTGLTPNIPIYITKNSSEYLISIIHKDIAEENIKVVLTLPTYTKAKMIRYLCNQTVVGTQGISFGEITFDGSKDGIPIHVNTKSEKDFVLSDISSNNGVYTFIVDNMSICIISIPIVAGGAYFTQINDEDEDNTLVTIRANPLDDPYDSVPTTMSVKQFKKDYQQDL